ncbi:hypothetical protein [Hoylesella timonensis]|uniref:hypothetical protein n=2 Tax=Hoylesella timonensis TaxID=386414 RepID=UPI000A5AABEC|nr:hypothetical protein [Hoylesella timonensis]
MECTSVNVAEMPQILAYLGNRNTKNDRYMAIVIRDNGTVRHYLAFSDNLGSILSVMDEMLQRFMQCFTVKKILLC